MDKGSKASLAVEIKTNEGWKKITDITTIGPLAPREIIVPLDLSKTTGSLIEIRLSSGFMFWEVDYAGIDYSSDKEFQVETIQPSVAIDETGKNVLFQLIKKNLLFFKISLCCKWATDCNFLLCGACLQLSYLFRLNATPSLKQLVTMTLKTRKSKESLMSSINLN